MNIQRIRLPGSGTFLLLLLLVNAYALPACADSLVRSRPCPFSCRSEGIDKRHCKDWRRGNTCYVEDLRKNKRKKAKKANRRPQQSANPTTSRNTYGRAIYPRGVVTARNCPYSCRTEGLSKAFCRDWQRGNTCYVEDRRTAGTGQEPIIPSATPYPVPKPMPRPIDSGAAACNRLGRGQVAPPRIDIYRVRSSGFFSSKVKVYGTIEGRCIKEAGAFEEGRRREQFRIPLSPEFQRYEFSTRVDRNDIPEIRAYNIFGERDIVPIQRDFHNYDHYDRFDRRPPFSYRDQVGPTTHREPVYYPGSSYTGQTVRPSTGGIYDY